MEVAAHLVHAMLLLFCTCDVITSKLVLYQILQKGEGKLGNGHFDNLDNKISNSLFVLLCCLLTGIYH
jgi:hypothetical protein